MICILLFCFIVLYFLFVSLCFEVDFRIAKLWRRFVRGTVGAPGASIIIVPATSGEIKGRVRRWMMKVW